MGNTAIEHSSMVITKSFVRQREYILWVNQSKCILWLMTKSIVSQSEYMTKSFVSQIEYMTKYFVGQSEYILWVSQSEYISFD